MALTGACLLLTVGMYVLILGTATVNLRVLDIRTELRQELVESVIAKLDSLNQVVMVTRFDRLKAEAKVDSLRMELRHVQP
jgi:hypothetical protein